MTNVDLTVDKELRSKLAGRVEVLDKVKKLILLPELEMMTVQQVAEYYCVPDKTVNDCYRKNREEIIQDGCRKFSLKEIIERIPSNSETVNNKTYKEIKLSDSVTIRVPNAGIIMFSKRAILRIGMLLRDSEIAKEVRTQLLNIAENTSDEVKVIEFNEEQGILAEIITSIADNNIEGSAMAITKYVAYKNRHIERLENNCKMMSAEILAWGKKESMVRAVRCIANRIHKGYGEVFNELYDELRYKHGIGLSQRQGKGSMASKIRDKEWPDVQKSLAAICVKYELDPSEIAAKAKLVEC